MNYVNIEKNDTVNGTGIRVTLYVSGCSHACPGCFNPESWDYKAGVPYTKVTESYLLDLLGKPHISGLSLLGGEPMADKNWETVLKLCQKVKEVYPEKTIWLWTGYTKSELGIKEKVLDYVEVLVDGKYQQDNPVKGEPWRGSKNQVIHWM